MLPGGLRRGCLEDLAHDHRDLIRCCGVARPQVGGRRGQRGPAGLVQRPYLLIAQHKGDKLPAARIGEQADQPGSQVIGDNSHATIVQATKAYKRHSSKGSAKSPWRPDGAKVTNSEAPRARCL